MYYFIHSPDQLPIHSPIHPYLLFSVMKYMWEQGQTPKRVIPRSAQPFVAHSSSEPHSGLGGGTAGRRRQLVRPRCKFVCCLCLVKTVWTDGPHGNDSVLPPKLLPLHPLCCQPSFYDFAGLPLPEPRRTRRQSGRWVIYGGWFCA